MSWLQHHGIDGMHWGVRRFQDKFGKLTPEGKERYKKKPETLFVSGSSKTQDKESGYYRKNLSKPVVKELKKSMKAKDKIIVGDAPGIDRQVQDFLNKRKYDNVEIYGPGKEVRYTANKKWKTNPIDAPEFEVGSKEWLAKKDKAMTDAATKGLAVILDEGAAATRKNVARLVEQNKDVKVYMLGSDMKDKWTDTNMITSPDSLTKSMSKNIRYKEFDRLMSPEEVGKSGKGSCHDQVMYEAAILKKMNIDPKALFVMESSGKQGGMTHSLVYFTKNGKVFWIENAWSNRAGIHEFNNVNEIKQEIRKAHSTGEFGDKKKYKSLNFGDFNLENQKPGETLQELVDNIKWY